MKSVILAIDVVLVAIATGFSGPACSYDVVAAKK